MNIGLIGFGYWGKIILSTLQSIGSHNIYIYDKNPVIFNNLPARCEIVTEEKLLFTCDKVFIVTPVSTHFDLCKSFLSKGMDVFCEKPLDTDPSKVNELFDLANSNNCHLFVDWLFTNNPAVNKIKSLINNQNLIINSIMANRMNLGPVRYDTDAKWDLASHDVSICNYILNSKPDYTKWINFKRNIIGVANDSSIGLLKYINTSVQINVSWHYPIKDRTYIIDCGNDGIIRWDDTSKEIIFNNTNIYFDQSQPLTISIEQFLNNPICNHQQTLDITSVLYENTI